MIKLIQLLLVIFFPFCVTDLASAYPEFTRVGYSHCFACHYSPSGGGLLRPYGRGLSNEISTMSWEDADHLDFGVTNYNFPIFGGDIRTLNKKDRDNFNSYIMSGAVSTILQLNKYTFAVGQINIEKPINIDDEYDGIDVSNNNHYVLISSGQSFYRVGRFRPAYGLNVDDHSLQIKRELGIYPNNEPYTLEALYYMSFFEFFVSKSQNHHEEISNSSLFIMPTKKIKLGFSWQKNPNNHYIGYSLITDLWFNFYALAEYDKLKNDDIFYFKLAYEHPKGLHFFSEYQKLSPIMSWGIDFYPIPHFKFTYKYNSDIQYFISHYYF